MKKRFKYLLGFICVFILFLIFSKTYSTYLNNKIDKMCRESLTTGYGFKEKEKGLILQEEAINDGDIMFLGSSELGSKVKQNPGRFFPNSYLNKPANLIGSAHVQDLQHAMNLASVDGYKNKKVVYILSIQWFFNKNGNTDEGFLAKFSPVQYLKILNDKDISNDVKKQIAERVNFFTKNDENFKDINYINKVYINKDSGVKGKVAYYVNKPYIKARLELYKLKDKYLSMKALKKLPENKKLLSTKNIDFQEEYKKAKDEGKAKTTNNKYYIEDKYFDKYLRKDLTDVKDRYVKDKLYKTIMNSKEFDDYKLFLQVCKEKNVKPYIVLMPVNGSFYDYMGLNKENRNEFYTKAQGLAEKYGFQVLNLKDKEYEPYFMYDHMHLGWKGWLYINEKVIEFMGKS